MSIRGSFNQLTEFMEKRDSTHEGFLKTLLVSASSFLGLLIALHNRPSPNRSVHLIWALSLALVSLGILSASISAYEYVYVRERMYRRLMEAVEKQLSAGTPTFEPFSLDRKRVFEIVEKLSYVLLAASVVAFALYGIVSDVPLIVK